MALSKDSPRNYRHRGLEAALPVQASSTIYAGSAVSIDTGGEVGPLSTSDASFAGFARKQADNSSGSAGDINAAIITKGLIEVTVTGLDDNDDLNDVVYMSDDDTLTLTVGSNLPIGRVFQIVDLATNKAVVLFKGAVHESPLD